MAPASHKRRAVNPSRGRARQRNLQSGRSVIARITGSAGEALQEFIVKIQQTASQNRNHIPWTMITVS